MAFQEMDMRYGMTVREILREIESPFFDDCKRKIDEPLDPSHKVFYGQFLREHFSDYSEEDMGVASIDLYNSFRAWRNRAMSVVDPKKYSEKGTAELYKIYEGMNLEGLFRHVDEESIFQLSPADPMLLTREFTQHDLNTIWLVAKGAWLLDRSLQLQNTV